MAGSAGWRAWPRRPGRRCAVAPPSWTSQPTLGDASASMRAQAATRHRSGLLPGVGSADRPRPPRRPGEPVALDLQVHPGAGPGAHRPGHPVSDDTVGRLLREQGSRRRRAVQTLAGAQHADRDAQFRDLNEQAKQQLVAGQAVVSVDTKQKELGRPLCQRRSRVAPHRRARAGQRPRLPDPKVGKAIP